MISIVRSVSKKGRNSVVQYSFVLLSTIMNSFEYLFLSNEDLMLRMLFIEINRVVISYYILHCC
jgi:hypothetical protein